MRILVVCQDCGAKLTEPDEEPVVEVPCICLPCRRLRGIDDEDVT